MATGASTVVRPPQVVSQGNPQLDALARALSLECTTQFSADADQQYLYDYQGCLSLGLAPGAREHPVYVDFSQQWRKRHRGKELLLKAIGGRREGLRVIDATAGLGRDSFLLATYGASVELCERHPVVAALLTDGLKRAVQDPDVAGFVQHMTLHEGSAIERLSRCLGSADQAPDVVYVDPMFPDSGKSALVKKEMRLFHHLVGKDDDDDALLAAALAVARHRVVVKRPPKAPIIDGPALSALGARGRPQFAVTGKAVRFDVYPIKAFGNN